MTKSQYPRQLYTIYYTSITIFHFTRFTTIDFLSFLHFFISRVVVIIVYKLYLFDDLLEYVVNCYVGGGADEDALAPAMCICSNIYTR